MNKPHKLISVPSPLLSKLKTKQSNGEVQNITRQNANWHYVEFSVYHLSKGEKITLEKIEDEMCIVLIGGFADIKSATLDLSNIGDRLGPFERKKPFAVYLPPKEAVVLTALTELELGVCAAPAKGLLPARLITPDDIDAEARGIGNNKRFVHNILPQDKAAESLLVVEVYTDEGATSSYPSHKHDIDNPPIETYLEETYYHRLNPSKGFCMQRVYTDDRSLDESMAVYDGDVVMVPRGYHPVATIAGYDSYYLNVMAGPVRQWCFTWESEHQWINSELYANKIGNSKSL